MGKALFKKSQCIWGRTPQNNGELVFLKLIYANKEILIQCEAALC